MTRGLALFPLLGAAFLLVAPPAQASPCTNITDATDYQRCFNANNGHQDGPLMGFWGQFHGGFNYPDGSHDVCDENVLAHTFSCKPA